MPPLKASSGWGIYKGEGATSQFKPLPLIKKEKMESTSDSLRDSSVITTPARHDKLGYPQGKPTHNKHLQRKLLCHSGRYGESLHKATRQSQSYCHSERGQSPTEESLNESLVAKRDSSPLTGVQNDNSGRVSSNSNRDSSPAMQAQNDKLTAFTKNPNSNSSLLSQARAKKLNSIRV
ncbi:hypothetical protein CQA63_09310, partial [Helicobacter marmotae]